MELTAKNVDKMFEESNVDNGDINADFIDGRKIFFNSKKINKENLKEMLQNLPEKFQEKSGGGMTFLNACMDKKGNQWGEQIHVAKLMCLGIATGLVYYCMPKEMWRVLPGGVPYFGVKD